MVVQMSTTKPVLWDMSNHVPGYPSVTADCGITNRMFFLYLFGELPVTFGQLSCHILQKLCCMLAWKINITFDRNISPSKTQSETKEVIGTVAVRIFTKASAVNNAPKIAAGQGVGVRRCGCVSMCTPYVSGHVFTQNGCSCRHVPFEVRKGHIIGWKVSEIITTYIYVRTYFCTK